MSETFDRSPISPIQQRDIRSASKPFKRDKDHDQKWINGQRPSAGVSFNYSILNQNPDFLDGGSDSQREKVRPRKQWSQVTSDPKSYANRTPKSASLHNVSYAQDGIHSRLTKKVDAVVESNSAEPLSKSLLDLLPQHRNIASHGVQVAGDEGILYSFDARPSPNAHGREVDLSGLVERAEKKWESEQTEAMVKEYEVLDISGEAVKGSKKGKKGSRSPRNRAVKTESYEKAEEEDGFELV